jgi:DNA-binding transcriptional ArsR family regulator
LLFVNVFDGGFGQNSAKEACIVTEWTFLTKHAIALGILAKDPRVTALDLAGELGMTERAVRKLIADLYEAGYIRKKREGRRVRYVINPRKPLRQKLHPEVPVSDLLETLGWKPRPGRHMEE